MPRGHAPSRKDDNHNDISSTFARLGWSVKDVHQIADFADIIISRRWMTIAVTIIVEIKDGNKPPSKRKLTKGEREFKNMWQGWYALIETEQEAVDLHVHVMKHGRPPTYVIP